MGANAQTSVPLFTSGEILTAANQNLSAGTGVPVFASTTTRDAAFGGTGEKVLAEGQLCYVENLTGVAQLQYYDGSAWVSLGGSGFVVVKAETAFSAASSVTIDNVFTATYRNYKILVNYTSSTTAGPRLRMRVGGSSTSTATYNEQYVLGADSTASASRGASATSIAVGGNTNGSFNSSMEITIYNPQIATPTTVHSLNMNSQGAYTTPVMAVFGGNQSGSTSFDGIELFLSSGTLTGNYTVYGMATS
jgi:hypothetical protein